MTQDEYFSIVDMFFEDVKIDDKERMHVLAARFARERGSMSGRIAQQFCNAWELYKDK